MKHFWMGIAVILMMMCCPNVTMAQQPVKSVKRATAVPQSTQVSTKSQNQTHKVKTQGNGKVVNAELREDKVISKSTLEKKNMSAFEEAQKYGGKKSSVVAKKADNSQRAAKVGSKKRAKRVNRTKVSK